MLPILILLQEQDIYLATRNPIKSFLFILFAFERCSGPLGYLFIELLKLFWIETFGETELFLETYFRYKYIMQNWDLFCHHRDFQTARNRICALKYQYDLEQISGGVSIKSASSTYQLHKRYRMCILKLPVQGVLFIITGCPVKLFPLGYLLFCRLLLIRIAKVGTFLKNSGNLLHDRHKNFEN